MITCRTLAVGLLMMLFALSAFGDVAPDPGYTRISLNLVLESQDDLSNYRFFIKSGADAKEILLKKGESTVIEPLGGGAYYRAGTLVAVPRKSLEGFSDTPSGQKLSELQKAVYDGKVAGSIELVKHSFSREVPVLETGWQDPVYRIDRNGAHLKAVHVSGGANISKIDSSESSGRFFWQGVGAMLVAGVFLAFGLAIIGVIYFRKRAKTL